MKTKTPLILTLLLFLLPGLAWAQEHANHGPSEAEIFGLLELPFLLIAIVFSFLTARNLKGGKFGSGMSLLAWGFLVMAVGHLHMQIDHLFGYNLFNNLMGATIGRYAWFAALILTWGLSAFGFYKIYKASKV
ncbi:hypothetical protein POV27_20285 [Aureisphaera galaxeae]|uniref:hypothetical protein n=1 Tax=Aureisphaera galaxeae TaxID=1538023 RepID=UPI00234FEA46|nr:hypothetical protein [Aureisphaera galaxeae]MDC8006403.1 hypothetical protein [Aureisphaera galaxeae]